MNNTKLTLNNNRFLQSSGDVLSLSGTTTSYGNFNINGSLYFTGATSGVTTNVIYYNTGTKQLTYGEVASGGHLIYANNDLQIEQEALNFVNFSVEDQSDVGDGTSANKITHTFGDESNVNISGATEGNIVSYDSTNSEWITQEQVEDDRTIYLSQGNISADGQLYLYLPAGYGISSILITEINNSGTTISLGTTASGTTILNNVSISGGTDNPCPLGTRFFSLTNDSQLYISSPDWNGSDISIYIVAKIYEGYNGTDTSAVHVNAVGEFTEIAEKMTISANDVFLIEDSEDGYIKKKLIASSFLQTEYPTNILYVDSTTGDDNTGTGTEISPYATIYGAITGTTGVFELSGTTTSGNSTITMSATTNISVGDEVKSNNLPEFTYVTAVSADTSITISNSAIASGLTALHFRKNELIYVKSGNYEEPNNCYKDGVNIFFESGTYVRSTFVSGLFVNSSGTDYKYDMNIYGNGIFNADGSFYNVNNNNPQYTCYTKYEFKEIYANSYGFYFSSINYAELHTVNISGSVILTKLNDGIQSRNHFNVKADVQVINAGGYGIRQIYSIGDGYSCEFISQIINGGTAAFSLSSTSESITKGRFGQINNNGYVSSTNGGTCIIECNNPDKTLYVSGDSEDANVFVIGNVIIDWTLVNGTVENGNGITLHSGTVRYRGTSKYSRTGILCTVEDGILVIEEIFATSSEMITVSGGKVIINARIKHGNSNTYALNISGGEVWIYNEIDKYSSNPLKNTSSYITGGKIYLLSGGRIKNSVNAFDSNSLNIISGSPEINFNGGELYSDYGLPFRVKYGATPIINVLSGGVTMDRENIFNGIQKKWLVTVTTGATTSLRITDSITFHDYSESGATATDAATALVISMSGATGFTATDNLDGTFYIEGAESNFYPTNISNEVNCTSSEVNDESIPVSINTGSTYNYKGSSNRIYSISGDGSTTGFTVTHGYNQRFVNVEIVENTSPYSTIYTNVERPTLNDLYVTFETPPNSGTTYNVIVNG